MKKLYYSKGCKAMVSLLWILVTFITIVATLGYSVSVGYGFQSKSYTLVESEIFKQMALVDAKTLSDTYLTDPAYALDLAAQKSIDFSILDAQGQVLLTSDAWVDGAQGSVFSLDTGNGHTVLISLDNALTSGGLYTWARSLAAIGYQLRFSGIAVIIGLSLLSLGLFALCMRLAGRRPGESDVALKVTLPLDILGVLSVFLVCGAGLQVFTISKNGDWWEIIAIFVGVTLGALVLTLWYCSYLATCIKTGHWYRYTALGWLVRQFLRFCRWVGRIIADLTWPVALFGAVSALLLGGLTLLCVLPNQLSSRIGFLALVWLGGGLLLAYCLWMLSVLEKGGRVMAAGDLNGRIDTRHLICSFKSHAKQLNAVSVGLSQAVELQMKSERLKTQLITNVSHDLKTPLTSILNYTGLIAAEPCNNPKIQEYSAVLMRQAQRLKTLTENLMEASKASTGNVDVNLSACNVTVLAEQIAGEYAQRLEDCNLTMVHRLPEPPLTIRADGQLLWRVFDNLMNNICKYSQPHTRVYVTAAQVGSEVEITFKNTSRYELAGNPEELLERFNRGDSARHTEGNGLGLSIAQSLTELQKGTFSLAVDGDLFKATVRFPVEGE